MKHHGLAKIENHINNDGIYTISLHAPEIAQNAKPGQFIMVYLDKGEHLLPRPISLYDVDKSSGIITLVYVVAGAGTKIMTEWPEGHNVRVMGPIGNGFNISKLHSGNKVALVGGGFGAAPLFYLAKELNKLGVEMDVYLGFRKAAPGLVEGFKAFTANIYTAVGEGTYVTDLLPAQNTYASILSCGPASMLKALSAYANARNIPCQISVEERMACGVGACKGCVVKTLMGYKLCCNWGPVFNSREVIFDD